MSLAAYASETNKFMILDAFAKTFISEMELCNCPTFNLLNTDARPFTTTTTILVLKYFLAYLGSSAKTTSILKCSFYIKLEDS